MSSQPVERQRPRAHTGDQPAELAIFDATEALLAAHPLHELSVAQIIKAAGLSRASFYHYFSSKFEVVAALMQRIFAEIYSETRAELEEPWSDPGESLRSSLRLGLDLWVQHRAVVHAALENMHAVPALATAWSTARAPFVSALSTQVQRERAAGRSAGDLAPQSVAELLVCGAERIFYVGSTGAEERLASIDEQLDAIVAIALAAIYSSPAGPGPRGA